MNRIKSGGKGVPAVAVGVVRHAEQPHAFPVRKRKRNPVGGMSFRYEAGVLV